VSVISSSGETRLKVQLVAPKKTAEAPCKFLPAISTREPSGPLVGEILKISGRPVCAITTASGVEIRTPMIAIAIRLPMFTPEAIGARTGEDARRLHYLTELALVLGGTVLLLP
jgi:hypothetical protein